MTAALFRFLLSGAAATLVHIAAALLWMAAGVPPLSANVLAFLIAFSFSFLAHHRFTFPDHQMATSTAFLRFAATAGLGFLTNETMLVLLLKTIGGPPQILLIASTGIAAVVTFIVCKTWVFRYDGS